MTERPILFSAEMVRAILEGRKTQTRRAIKPQPPAEAKSVSRKLYSMAPSNFEGAWQWWAGKPQTPITKPLFCPYGQPGDQLWVRETWAHYQTVNHVWRSDGRAFDEVSDGLVGYRADGHDSIEDLRAHVRLMSGCDLEHVIINGDRWRPSSNMPRWASRITLRITDVRVERVQDIREDDARAEGVSSEWDDYERYGQSEPYRYGFSALWTSINGPGAWDANPWVWAISFEGVKP